MVGERNVVEIVVFVVGVERAPGAVLALQSQDPFLRARDRRAVIDAADRAAARGPSPSPPPRCRRRRDNAGWRIGTPSRRAGHPAAARSSRLFTSSTCFGSSHCSALAHPRQRLAVAGLQQRMAGEPGVPDRRDAGLAIGLVGMHDQQLLDRAARDRPLRMIRRIAQRVEHHHAVRHRRIDRAEPVLAVEPLGRPRPPRASIARWRVPFGNIRLAQRAAGCRRRGRTRTTPRSAAAPSAPARASPADRETARRSGCSSDCAPAASAPSAPAAAR